jgi:hypothetical protein
MSKKLVEGLRQMIPELPENIKTLDIHIDNCLSATINCEFFVFDSDVQKLKLEIEDGSKSDSSN